MCETCDKNIWNKKYERLTKYLFKMKEFNHTVLKKGIFVSLKGHLCLTNVPLANPEGQVEMKSPSW